MIVLHLTDCPPGFKGDLTKWLFEIASGVYVGQVSARVRDKLWLRVQETCRRGRVVMVYNCANTEHRLDFRVHGDTWEPIDFDGIKLMLRPNAPRIRARQSDASSSRIRSNASKGRTAKRFSAMRARYPLDYVVVDLIGASSHKLMFPAHAGVIPRTLADRGQHKHVPRIRGGDPVFYRGDKITALCSPHMQG